MSSYNMLKAQAKTLEVSLIGLCAVAVLVILTKMLDINIKINFSSVFGIIAGGMMLLVGCLFLHYEKVGD